jgi:hypothetical protein
MRATPAAREGRAQNVTGGAAGRGSEGSAAWLVRRLLVLGAQLVQAPDSPAREAGHDQTIGPVAKPLPTPAPNQEEEEVLGWARA